MTFLELINKVLRKLREDQVSAVDAEDYVQLVGQMVNEAKEEIEDRGPWYALRTTINKTLTPATSTVDLTTETNERSYLLYSGNMPQAWVVDEPLLRNLCVIEQGEMDKYQALYPSQPDSTPIYVSFNKDADGLTAQFFPTPAEALDVRFVFVIPQDELADEDDEILIPSGPVWRLAALMAMEERGEEMAGPIDRAERRAAQALDSAILTDYGKDSFTFEAE